MAVAGLLASEVRAVGGVGDAIGDSITGSINDLGNAVGGPIGDGTGFSRDEVEQFINRHTDLGNPAAERPTEHAVTETLDH